MKTLKNVHIKNSLKKRKEKRNNTRVVGLTNIKPNFNS